MPRPRKPDAPTTSERARASERSRMEAGYVRKRLLLRPETIAAAERLLARLGYEHLNFTSLVEQLILEENQRF